MERMYQVKDIPGKGKGLVATVRIAKGTRLLSETPIFRVPQNTFNIQTLEAIVESEVQRLTIDQRASFFDLTNIYGDDRSNSLGIARTNALPLVDSADAVGGLFLEASRINHSCRQNAQNTWNENIGKLTIHAIRDIDAGEEITISYLASTPKYKYAERRRHLIQTFGFICKCELCLLPMDQRELSDGRLRGIQIIDYFIGRLNSMRGNGNPAETLNNLRSMLDLFEREGIYDARVPRAYNDAFEITIGNEDLPRAQIFATRAYEARRVVEGEDSPRAMKMKLAATTISAQPPEGLDKAEFEDWLWMAKDMARPENDLGYD